MPYRPGEEEGLVNREWVFAEYATNPDGSRSKVPGTGTEVDRLTRAAIPNRGWNRPDQRYELPIAEIRDRRSARAIAEAGSCLVVRMDGGECEVVSASENRYDVNGPGQPNSCACPDFVRLGYSYPGEDVVCKHILIARIKEAERAPDPLDVGVLFVAEAIGVHYKTVQTWCSHGVLPATKVKRTWVITTADALAFIDAYRLKMYDPDFMATLEQLLTPLVSNPTGKKEGT